MAKRETARDTGYCSPCGECVQCRKEADDFAELRKLRRWRRRVLKFFGTLERALYLCDPEREQPIVRTLERRMKAMENAKVRD